LYEHGPAPTAAPSRETHVPAATRRLAPGADPSGFQGARQRRAIAAIIIDPENVIVMANQSGLQNLRLLAPQGHVREGRVLPDPIARLVNGLREEIVSSGLHNSSLLTLPTGVCLRGSLLEGTSQQRCLLLLVEPTLRLDERSLSRRELEVATLVLNGLSNREIAVKLVVAPHTVEGHLKRIFAKLQVRTRAGLVARMLGWEADADSPYNP